MVYARLLGEDGSGAVTGLSDSQRGLKQIAHMDQELWGVGGQLGEQTPRARRYESWYGESLQLSMAYWCRHSCYIQCKAQI